MHDTHDPFPCCMLMLWRFPGFPVPSGSTCTGKQVSNLLEKTEFLLQRLPFDRSLGDFGVVLGFFVNFRLPLSRKNFRGNHGKLEVWTCCTEAKLHQKHFDSLQEAAFSRWRYVICGLNMFRCFLSNFEMLKNYVDMFYHVLSTNMRVDYDIVTVCFDVCWYRYTDTYIYIYIYIYTYIHVLEPMSFFNIKWIRFLKRKYYKYVFLKLRNDQIILH